VTLPNGQSTALGFEELLRLLEIQPQLIRAVEPLTSCLTFVLYVHDRLWAWDFRSVVSAMAGDRDVQPVWGLLSHGPEMAQVRRRRAFYALPESERAQVIRDAVTSDIMEPGRKRVPLRGLLHPGWHDFDTGPDVDPFRVFRYFDAALGLGRKATTPESDLSMGDRLAYETASASSLIEDAEDYIQHITASLPPKQRAAVQHWLRAKHLGVEFTAYCKQHSLHYKTVHKAAMDGLPALRASIRDPQKNF
jgi:hypothetical protein